MAGIEIFSPMRWKSGVLYLIDQHRLPAEEIWLSCDSADDVGRAIRDMHVRGAPAIGCAAAYGVAIAAREFGLRELPAAEFRRELEQTIEMLSATRPTAVNLFWALSQMRDAAIIALDCGNAGSAAAALEARAIAIHNEDAAMCQRIGQHGNALIGDEATILTHCNAGALATGGYGTALGVIRAAHEAGKKIKVLADETRPYLQGSRLTAWELQRENINVTIIPDGAAAFLIRLGEVSCVIVGADRIAANGDVANKIGTYGVALAASANGVPFYVAAPTSTIDLETATGDEIPIEERAGSEMFTLGSAQIAPKGALARYPAFDITPAELISAIITDRGVARPPYTKTLSKTQEQT